jgi:hypothetical protein
VPAEPPQAPSTAITSGATNSAAGSLFAPTFACTATNIEVTMLDGCVMEIDEYQLRVNISMHFKQSKLTKNSTAIMVTENYQRIQYCAETDVSGTIEEERQGTGCGDSEKLEFVHVGEYQVK